MLEIILGSVVVVSFILLIVTICNNRLILAIMKIDKAEEDIDMYLEKKKELLNRTRPIITKELRLDSYLAELDDFNGSENNFEVNEILKDAYNVLFKTIDENEKLLKSETLNSILDSLEENEENIGGAVKFYNDTVVIFNHLIASFPSCIVAFFRRFKKKDFYSDEKKEMYEILNDK